MLWSWLIYRFTAVASTPGDFITLNITAGETEVGYDNLQIYDGVFNLLYDADGESGFSYCQLLVLLVCILTVMVHGTV